jgi:hypothetical protein
MNRSMLTFLLALAVVAGGLLIGPSAWSQQAFAPKFDAGSDTPNGCVDCHKASGGADTRLNVLLAAKKHVAIGAIVKSVPDGCGMCHRAGVKAGPLSAHAHEIHFVNSKGTEFVPPFQGACLACHVVDAKGAAKVKIAPKNW